ncbi:MAG: cupin domain-containing protein [Firmicutes bacterium]|nr:cupin domain-containing protein [Bacillota bacterium]
MIRRKEECTIEYREKMRGGNGTNIITNFISSPEELNGKGRLFARLTLQPGNSIGFHVHEKDAELFYILSGTGTYSDNGTIVKLYPGDVAICPTGTGHSMANETDDVLEFVALIINA